MAYGGKAVYQCAPDNFANFNLDADITLLASGTDSGVIFRVNNPAIGADNYYGYYAGISPGSTQVVLGKAAGGSWTQISVGVYTTAFSLGVQYHLRVSAVGSVIKVFVTDMAVPVISVSDVTYTTGMIGLREYNDAASWDNILVSSP